jgi:long-subunit fatty acid transport protein
VNGSYRRQLTRKLSGIAGGRYSPNVSTPTSARSFDNYALDAGVGYQFSKSFTLDANYTRVHQTQSNAFLIGNNTYNDNRVGVSISYSWSHPLGR